MPDLRSLASQSGLAWWQFSAGQQTQIMNALSSVYSKGHSTGYLQASEEGANDD